MFNLVEEIKEKITGVDHPEGGELDGDHLHSVIEWIDDIEDDAIWDSFSLPLQCWYNDCLLEFEEAENDAKEKGVKCGPVDPLEVDEYDSSALHLEAADLVKAYQNTDYLFVIATDKKYFTGKINDIDLEGAFVALLTTDDKQRSFSITDITTIRLVPDQEIADELIQDFIEEFGLDDSPEIATDKKLEEKPAEVKKEAEKVEKATPVKKSEPTKKKKVAKVKEAKKSASVRFKEIIISDPMIDKDEAYKQLCREGFKYSAGSAAACYADTLQTLRVMNSMGITRMKLED